MNILALVTSAKLGNNDDYGILVRHFQAPLLATLEGITKDRHSAEELVQESFVRAWLQLASLRNASAFPSWLWRIARNLAFTWLRNEESDLADNDGDIDRHPDPRPRDPAQISPWFAGNWELLCQGLDPGERTLLELRYAAGISLNEIALVLQIPEQRVKGRLFRIRKRLARTVSGSWPRPAHYNAKVPVFLKERIMNVIDSQKLGSHVFMRLSLAMQEDLARSVIAGKALGPQVLAAIGQVDRGAEFLTRYGTQFTLAELIGILNNVDRFTEMRLVEDLERIAPADAEAIKQNMFVFEDFVLFDPAAIRVMVEESDQDILATALAGTDSSTRQHIVSALDDHSRAALEKRIAACHGGFNLALAAQEAIVNGVKDLENSGRLLIRRKDDKPDGEIIITIRDRVQDRA